MSRVLKSEWLENALKKSFVIINITWQIFFLVRFHREFLMPRKRIKKKFSEISHTWPCLSHKLFALKKGPRVFQTYFLYLSQAPGLGINLSRFPFLSLSDSIFRIRYWWYEDKLFNNSIFFMSKQRWNIFAFACRSAEVTGGIGLGLYGENPKNKIYKIFQG